MAKASTKLFTHNVHKPLRHDGDDYVKGETVELTESQAKPLIEIGVVSVAEVVDPPASTTAMTRSKLSKFTVADLLDYAKTSGVTVPEGSTKDQIITAILGPDSAGMGEGA